MKEISNSPISVLVIFLIVAGVIYYRNKYGLDRRCSNCNKGLLEEVSAKPESFGDGSSATATSTAWVFTLLSTTALIVETSSSELRTDARLF